MQKIRPGGIYRDDWDLPLGSQITIFLENSAAKRILERFGIQTSSSFVFLNLKPFFYFLGVYMAWFFI
jgi:hypothetical protein